MPTDLVGKQIAVSVQFDVVKIEIICGDEYLAQVLFDDMVERLKAGQGLTIKMQQPSGAQYGEDPVK